MYGHFFCCQEWNKNGVIIGVENSSSTHTINRKIDILVLREGPKDRLDDTTTTEVEYSVNITRSRKKILSLPYMQTIAFCMLMA